MLAARSRWWNSTGGGSHDSARVAQKGNIKAGDGGKKFRAEWPEEDAENWKWMRENNVDMATGQRLNAAGGNSCGPQLVAGIGGSSNQAQAVVDAVVQQREAGRGWMARNKLLVAGGVIFIYVLIARLLGEGI